MNHLSFSNIIVFWSIVLDSDMLSIYTTVLFYLCEVDTQTTVVLFRGIQSYTPSQIVGWSILTRI